MPPEPGALLNASLRVSQPVLRCESLNLSFIGDAQKKEIGQMQRWGEEWYPQG